MNRADDFMELVKKTQAYSFDVEHLPDLSWSKPGFELLGVSFATEGMEFYSTDFEEYKLILQTLFPLEVEAIAYNIKYDLKCLTAIKICDAYSYPVNPIDPMMEVNLLDENRRHGELGLKAVVWDQYGYRMMEFPEAFAFGPNSPQFEAYAIDDARWEFKLHRTLKPKVVEEGLWKLFTVILMPTTLSLADLEYVGVGWDIDWAKKLLRGFQEIRTKFEKEVYSEIGKLNLGSGDQIAKRLFDELGYPTKGLEMTKSGKRMAVDAAAMDKLARKFPVCDKIVKYRTCDKMISTYVEPITRDALDDPNSRVHGSFWLPSTTGRTRCSDPNWQNIPAWLDELFKELNIRKAVVARPGWSLLVGDQSQIELRVCGHYTQDPLFLSAYRNWKCGKCKQKGSSLSILHVCPNCGNPEHEGIIKTGKKYNPDGFWHGEDIHQQTTDLVPALKGNRQFGKTTNFALIYLAGAWRLHYEQPSLSPDEWQDVIDQFFAKYVGVKRWHIRCERQMYSTGVIQDLFGRKRRISRAEINKNAKHALNMFVNMPIQASAAHYIMLAFSRLRQKWIKSGEWMRTIFQSNFVHDECVHECPDELAEKYSDEIRYEMENVVQLSVPMRYEIKKVKRWGEAKE